LPSEQRTETRHAWLISDTDLGSARRKGILGRNSQYLGLRAKTIVDGNSGFKSKKTRKFEEHEKKRGGDSTTRRYYSSKRVWSNGLVISAQDSLLRARAALKHRRKQDRSLAKSAKEGLQKDD